MKIRIKAPNGYKYRDTRTGHAHSEAVIEAKDKKHFKLIADNAERIMEG